MLLSTDLTDYMHKNPVTVRPDMTVFEAARRILENKVSGVVVINERKELVGVLSEMDCLGAILANQYHDAQFAALLVQDVMTKEVDVQGPDDNILDVAMSMLNHKHRRRPVVLDGKLIGQVTCRQILNYVITGRKTSR